MADQIILGMGLKTTNFEQGLNSAVRTAENAAGKIEHHFSGRGIGMALATSFGLNIEKMADKVARLFADMSEEQQKAIETVEKLNDQSQAVFEARMIKRRSDEQQVAKLHEELARLDAEVERRALAFQGMKGTIYLKEEQAAVRKRVFEEQSIRRAEIDVALERATTAEHEKQIALAKKAADVAQADTERDIKELDVRLQIGVLTDLEVKQQKELVEFKGDNEIREIKVAELARTTLMLKEATFAAEKADGDEVAVHYRERLKYAEENKRMLELEFKSRQGLSQEEVNELQVLRLKVQERKNEVQITALLTTPMLNMTAEQRKQLAILIAQNKVIEARITGLVPKVIESETKIIALEQDVIDKRIKELQANDLLNESLQTTVEINGKLYGPSRNPANFEGASDAELKELIRRAKLDIADIKASEGKGSGALPDAVSGFYIQENAIDQKLTDIQRAQYQLDQRNNARKDFTFGGVDNARQRFQGDPLQFDQLFAQWQGTQTETAKTNNLLGDLVTELKGSNGNSNTIPAQIAKLTDGVVAVAQQLNQRGLGTGG